MFKLLFIVKLNQVEETQNNENSYTEVQLIKNSNNQVLNPQKLKVKSSLLLGRSNTPTEEKDFRKTCRLYRKLWNPSIKLKKAYQEYIENYNRSTSLYFLYKIDDEAALIIYNTENEREDIQMLETYISIDKCTCVAQLPDGELFYYYDNFLISGIRIIIDINYEIHTLPSGKPLYISSAIYFNKNVYCFGGNANRVSKLSNRFDLDRNRWIELTPLPKDDECCHSIIFNGNILISGYINRNLLIYSVNIDSFSVINYNFQHYVRKILINAEERLYLIEGDNGSIYESELGNEYIWELIGKSPIPVNPTCVYWVYNKGAIYIGCIGCIERYSKLERNYYKFDLKKKALTEIRKGWISCIIF